MSTTKLALVFEEMTLRQLRRIASDYGVSRYSRMRKSQLIAAIEQIEQRGQPGSNFPQRRLEAQEEVGAAKFNLGQEMSPPGDSLVLVDEGLPDLPKGYGESRIVMMPRDPQWAYVYWDLPNDQREKARCQGGQMLTLRLYDVTNWHQPGLPPVSIQEEVCDELAREWYLSLPVSDRDYCAEIGYRTPTGQWLALAQSSRVHIPPIYPSEWVEDHFVEVSWDEQLGTQDPICTLPVPDMLPHRTTEPWVFHASMVYANGSGHHVASSHVLGEGEYVSQNGKLLHQFLNPTLQALPLTLLFQAQEDSRELGHSPRLEGDFETLMPSLSGATDEGQRSLRVSWST